MADIDLQRKKRSWWPFIIGALALILVIWGIAELMEDDAPVAIDDPALVEPAPGPAAEMGVEEPAAPGAAAAIADFRTQCVETTDDQDMGLQHEWTVGCLESLATAMDASIRADTVGSVILEERLTTLRQRAADVREADPSATTHAATVTEAFDAAAELVATYQDERGTADANYAEDLRQAADRLDSDQLLLEQRDAVHAFFREAGDALQTISTR